MLQAVKKAIFEDPDPSNPRVHIHNLGATINIEVDNALYQALENCFRRPFEILSQQEKTFNPYHLLRVLEVYNELYSACDDNLSIDPDEKKCELFWRQIVGYVRRFMPACYTRDFQQLLYCLARKDLVIFKWSPEEIRQDFKLRFNNFLRPLNPRSDQGFDFDVYTASEASGKLWSMQRCLGLFEKIFSGKIPWFSRHYAASSNTVARPA